MKTSDILIELTPEESGMGEYRTISDRVLYGKVRIPASQAASSQAWSRLQTFCDKPGDIRHVDENLAKNYPVSKELWTSVYSWLQKQGLPDLYETASESAIVCKAAMFHHDMSGFSDSIFCIVWLEKSLGLELAFPQLGLRIPLHYGTIVVFDAGQPHGVVFAGAEAFEFNAYAELLPQALLSIDFNALIPGVPEVMGHLVRETVAGWPGVVVEITDDGPRVDELNGKWLKTGSYKRMPREAANPGS